MRLRETKKLVRNHTVSERQSQDANPDTLFNMHFKRLFPTNLAAILFSIKTP